MNSKESSQEQKDYPSETAKVRHLVLPYLREGWSGLDLGYGGDPIVNGAIKIDLPDKYSSVGQMAQNLFGDARNLYWFRNETLDYVFSSHLLEDFAETKEILTEWLRVIKQGGLLIVYLPNEMKYRQHCQATGQVYNTFHKIEAMSIDYMRKVFEELGMTKEVMAVEHPDSGYSFLMILTKQSVDLGEEK